MQRPQAVVGTVLLPSVDGRVACLWHAQVAWQDQRITSVTQLDGPPPPGSPLVVPGFVDLHFHWPQAHVRGQFSGQLLPWLRESIWPAEAEFADAALARQRAEAVLASLLRAGTTAGLFFGPPFAEASIGFASVAPRGFLEGPALMEVNGPAALLRPVATTLAALGHHPDWPKGRVAVSPRFAPNVPMSGLQACARAAADVAAPVQSHLSENLDEVAWVRDLFPTQPDYTAVYEAAGLLGPRTVLAHGIHLSDDELARLAASGTLIAHCPTSNEALSSGRMPLERLRTAGVAWVLATDVGAGPLLSQLDTISAFVEAHRGYAEATACEGLCRATAVPGAWLAQFDPALCGLGTLAVGAPAHVVALPRPADLGEHADAEAWMRALLTAPRDRLESLPDAVWCWGQPVPWPA